MLDYKVCVTFYFANQNAAQQARIDAAYFVSPLFCHPEGGAQPGDWLIHPTEAGFN